MFFQKTIVLCNKYSFLFFCTLTDKYLSLRINKNKLKMPQTLCNILVHLVFHKKTSAPIIRDEEQHRLNRFVQCTCKNLKCHCLIANGTGDHLHLLVAWTPELSVAKLVKEVKRTATGFLKECDGAYYHEFYWQSGYGAFSVSYKLKDVVYKYIACQKEHHQKQTVRNEFEALLKNANIIDYNIDYYWY